MNLFTASPTRTIVPIIVGSVLGLLTRAGLDIDLEGQQALSTLIDSAFIGAYYLIIRLIETKMPQIGWLLGLAKTPDSYTADTVATETKHRATRA